MPTPTFARNVCEAIIGAILLHLLPSGRLTRAIPPRGHSKPTSQDVGSYELTAAELRAGPGQEDPLYVAS